MRGNPDGQNAATRGRYEFLARSSPPTEAAERERKNSQGPAQTRQGARNRADVQRTVPLGDVYFAPSTARRIRRDMRPCRPLPGIRSGTPCKRGKARVLP